MDTSGPHELQCARGISWPFVVASGRRGIHGLRLAHRCRGKSIDTHIYMYIHIQIHNVYIHTYIHTYMHAYIHKHTHIHIYIYISMKEAPNIPRSVLGVLEVCQGLCCNPLRGFSDILATSGSLIWCSWGLALRSYVKVQDMLESLRGGWGSFRVEISQAFS